MVSRILLWTACVWLAPLATSVAHELPPIGTLPELGADWVLLADDQRTKTDSTSPFRWIVFRHRKSGDYLSFASLPPEKAEKRGLEFWADTAVEIFPDGRPVWTQKRPAADEAPTHTVLNLKVASHDKQPVLEHCFISEAPDRTNLMAHGRVWAGPRGILFVQHTSTRPITPETVQGALAEVLRGRLDRAAPRVR